MATRKPIVPMPEVACAKCGKDAFDLIEREFSVHGLVHFVRCKECHTVIGALDGEVALRVEELAGNLSSLESDVEDLERALKKQAR